MQESKNARKQESKHYDNKFWSPSRWQDQSMTSIGLVYKTHTRKIARDSPKLLKLVLCDLR